MREKKLLTASDLASLCQVDLKTIHNWVDRGRIAHFRTPGRHLRFRAADVAEFLRTWGYTVPRELAKASSRSVAVVGSAETTAHVTRALGSAPSRNLTHPYDALVYAGADPPDVYVVDATAVAGEVDVNRMLEALHRACPQATFITLADELPGMPSFATRVARFDVQGLKDLLEPAATSGTVPIPTPSRPERNGDEPVQS